MRLCLTLAAHPASATDERASERASIKRHAHINHVQARTSPGGRSESESESISFPPRERPRAKYSMKYCKYIQLAVICEKFSNAAQRSERHINGLKSNELLLDGNSGNHYRVSFNNQMDLRTRSKVMSLPLDVVLKLIHWRAKKRRISFACCTLRKLIRIVH